MTAVILIGAGKFALEVTSYLQDALKAEGRSLTSLGYLALDGEEVAAPAAATRPFDPDHLRGEAALVLATSDPERRPELIELLLPAMADRLIRIVHPSSTVAAGAVDGAGIIIGPHCHVGVNARVKDLTIINYLASVGHHSTIGTGNFISPGFHCGNSATIGDGNFFGLGCIVGPGVVIGNRNRVQAGSALLENVGDGLFCFPSSRTKSMAL
jgi:UDP-3-O-[3-hydroxymyristoyl] glucosamine N-acyltransferase